MQWAKIASTVGGILLIAGGVFVLLVAAFVTSVVSAFGPEDAGWVAALAGAVLVVASLGGVALGIVVLVAARRLEGPDGRKWAIVTLVCGIVALVTGAGLFVGALAVAAGGALALAAQPQAA